MKRRSNSGAAQPSIPPEANLPPISTAAPLPKSAKLESRSDRAPPSAPIPIVHTEPNRIRWHKMDISVDQQIPICKDYHDTGYCTFGASCKFMHIRDDVLSSSQLDRKLALDAFKKSQEAVAVNCEEPEVCPICGKSFKEAVVTVCRHKFCGECAVKRYQKDHGCAVCGSDTRGIFNSVT
jgi:RING finger protein 113A